MRDNEFTGKEFTIQYHNPLLAITSGGLDCIKQLTCIASNSLERMHVQPVTGHEIVVNGHYSNTAARSLGIGVPSKSFDFVLMRRRLEP